ncbi:MAG: CDP-alcohol phosphatidyltransferase family protein [Planctomycetota bacterium]
MTEKPFGGDKKLPMKSLLAKMERKLIDSTIGYFPSWIQGYHLTLMTILWSAGVIAFGRLAQGSPHWLWGTCVMLFLQWFTDSFDGSLGRLRNTGIPRWGYYMDHFLDFIFMNSLLIGYYFIVGAESRFYVVCLMALFSAFMTNSFLSFSATNEFKITFLGAGPTEVRIYFIFVNIGIICFGMGWIEAILPYLLGLAIVGLCVIVFRTQKYVWGVDMANKEASK